jgi:hypothetical protein
MIDKSEIPGDFNTLTKKYSQKERDETAQNIHENRTKYFSRINSIKTVIENLDLNKTANYVLVEETNNNIDQIKSEIGDRNSSIIQRLFNYSEIRNLIQSKEELELKSNQYQNNFNEIVNKITELNNNLSDKN